MNKEEVISQLNNLWEHCHSMIDRRDENCVWRKDVKALEEAIRIIQNVKVRSFSKKRRSYEKRRKGLQDT